MFRWHHQGTRKLQKGNHSFLRRSGVVVILLRFNGLFFFWLGMWLKLNRLWWQRNSCYSSTKFLTRRTFCNEDQTQWPMLKFECYLTSLVLVSPTLGEREEESPVEWPGSQLFLPDLTFSSSENRLQRCQSRIILFNNYQQVFNDYWLNMVTWTKIVLIMNRIWYICYPQVTILWFSSKNRLECD